jgi:hypothetical protein
MEGQDHCIDCQRWEKSYEMATLSHFRLRSQFQIASFCGDPESVQKIGAEIRNSQARMKALKEAAQTHRRLVHGSAVFALRVRPQVRGC